MVIDRLLDSVMKSGTLTIIDATGRTHVYGDGEPTVTIRFHDKTLPAKLLINPELYVGEAFMDGTLTVEDGDIYDFLALVTKNLAAAGKSHWVTATVEKLQYWGRRLGQYNPVPKARENVAHHYDLSGTLYALFLDKDLQYSCAYFAIPDQPLEAAQERKKNLIAAKLMLKPEHEVLDIGCGWGGLALHLNRVSGARVTGITLSAEQLQAANARASRLGVADRVKFRLQDYRQVAATYDRIVSVGMFEHVGVPHFKRYFNKVRDCLKDNGIALLHTIGRSYGPGITDAWTRKYIFPGGYVPALSEFVPVIEKVGLVITDIEVLRLHYAETLRQWRTRFNAHRNRICDIYDERFCRMWDFFLASSECGFRYRGLVVFQVQLAKHQDAVPLDREYLAAACRPATMAARS